MMIGVGPNSELFPSSGVSAEEELKRAVRDLHEMSARDSEEGAILQGGNAIVMQIPVEVNIVLGRIEMSVADLTALRTGSTIPLDRNVGEPIDIVVNGVIVAKGEIILLDNDPSRFGFRISGIVE